MAKIRTLQLLGSSKAGGAELFFIRLMQAFADRPDDIEVLPLVRQGSWAAEQLAAREIRYLTAPFGGLFDRSTAKLGRRAAAKFQPNLCMSWMNRATRFMPPSPLARGPGSWATVARLGGYYPLKYYRGKVTELVGNTADIVTYCRQHGWPAAHVTQLGNFVVPPSAEWPTQRAQLRQQTRAALGIPADAIVLLIAARLHEVKGYDVALAALAQLPPSVHLLGLGEGPLRAQLTQQAHTLGLTGRVHLPGYANDQAPYAAAADLWLVPSRHEPLGNSVLDAWGYGLPLIATTTTGPASLISADQTGLLVPIDDPIALAAAVQKLLANSALATSLATAGRQYLAENFTADVVVGHYLAYYHRLIDDMERT